MASTLDKRSEKMTYTKAQRRRIYLKAAERIFEGKNGLCCIAISDIINCAFNSLNESNFPELFIFKPNGAILCWWHKDDANTRIIALCLAAVI